MSTSLDHQEAAQDAILNAIVTAAFKHEESGQTNVAVAIRKEGTKIAKRYGVSCIPGLPGTWKEKRGYQGYVRKTEAA